MNKKFNQEKFSKDLTDLNRHELGSISLEDIIDVSILDGAKRKEYLANAEQIWNNPVFVNEIKIMIQAQLEFIGKECAEFAQTLVARGTINGASILREVIQAYHMEYRESTKQKDKDFDPFAIGVGSDV